MKKLFTGAFLIILPIINLACGNSNVANENSQANAQNVSNTRTIYNSSAENRQREELIKEQEKTKKELDDLQKQVEAAQTESKELERRIEQTKKEIEKTKKEIENKK